MRRREFITLLGGAAAWPTVARGQQAAMPVIGFLSSLGPSDLGLVMPGFHQGLNGVGAKPRLPWLESLLSFCTGCGSKAANSSGLQRRLLISLHKGQLSSR